MQQLILQADTVQTVLTVSVGSIGSTPQAFVNGPAFLAGTSFPEQVIISNAGPVSSGVQQVTVSLRTWNDGACLFQGGLAGQFLSLDSVVAATAMRTNYNVMGSIDGTNLIYAHYLFDRTDFIQWQPFTNASFNGADAGFHVYPGAEIISITQKFASGNPLLYSCLLEQNGVTWAVGDQIENPRPNVWGGTGVWLSTFIGSPTQPGFGGELINLDYGGAGMHGGVAAVRGHNRQDAGYYLGLGGKVSAPEVLNFQGIHGSAIHLEFPPYGPQGYKPALIRIDNAYPANPDGSLEPFRILDYPGCIIFYNPNINAVTMGNLQPYSLSLGNGDSHAPGIQAGEAPLGCGRINCGPIHANDSVYTDGAFFGYSLVTSRGTPGGSSEGHVPKEMWSDDDYIYVGTSTGIKRVALTSF